MSTRTLTAAGGLQYLPRPPRLTEKRALELQPRFLVGRFAMREWRREGPQHRYLRRWAANYFADLGAKLFQLPAGITGTKTYADLAVELFGELAFIECSSSLTLQNRPDTIPKKFRLAKYNTLYIVLPEFSFLQGVSLTKDETNVVLVPAPLSSDSAE